VVGLSFLYGRSHATAKASAIHSELHPPSYAVDGVAETEWLLPNGIQGSLEVSYWRPRRASAVRLRNAHNRHYNDRATRAFKLEIYDGNELRASLEGEFQAFDSDPKWLTLSFPQARVSKVRFSVLSHFHAGGGLSELELR